MSAISTPNRAGTKRLPTEERRLELASAALQIIGTRGIKALTAATLAQAVGVTPGAIYRHFKGLDQVLEAAVDYAISWVEATLPPLELPPRKRLQEVTRSRVALIRSTPGLGWLLLSDQVPLALPAPAVKRLEQLVDRSRAYLRQAVLEAQGDGTLRSDMPPAVLLTLLSGAVHALARAPGVHALGVDTHAKAAPLSMDAEEVLASLFVLLSPPYEGTPS